jgi:integrase/recombinase XerD
MKLSTATASYIAHMQSMGMRFCTEASNLKSLCRALGDVPLEEIRPGRIEVYLAGKGPITATWERKYSTLKGFYRFALARGYVNCVPLPPAVPRPLRTFVPYIYTRQELRYLLDAVGPNDNPRRGVDPDTYRTLLLLLYGAALRISEALALTMVDVDICAGVIHVRDTKFYKSRLVPIGTDLTRILNRHVQKRRREHARHDSPFFCSRHGGAVKRQTAEITFKRLRRRAGILRGDGCTRQQPRLHDLRHSAAVHRLVSWYCSGADVQRLLPQLSTYLGHGSIAATQRYLTLTPELLRAACIRFERYAMGGYDE